MIQLKNEILRVTISERGGELLSVKSADGCEYLWQADPEFWPMHAPNLFPYVGRTAHGGIQSHGKTYKMPIHGFLMNAWMEPVQVSSGVCRLRLESSIVTWAQYPFDFVLYLEYAIEDNCLRVRYATENTGVQTLYYAVGGHPGFRVPFGPKGRFEDCRLIFEDAREPVRVVMKEDGYVTGEESPFGLEDGKVLNLTHDLFDRDAVVLKNAGNTVTLSDPQNGRGLKMVYEGFPFLGIWHNTGKPAPFVCLEPWSTLPSGEEDVESFETKAGMISLRPGEKKTREWSISVF